MKTRKAFYRALRQVAPLFTWEKTEYGVRGYQEGKTPVCALTAVYRIRSGDTAAGIESFRMAGAYLGLDNKTTLDIAGCFDGTSQTPAEKRSRTALMRAVGV